MKDLVKESRMTIAKTATGFPLAISLVNSEECLLMEMTKTTNKNMYVGKSSRIHAFVYAFIPLK